MSCAPIEPINVIPSLNTHPIRFSPLLPNQLSSTIVSPNHTLRTAQSMLSPPMIPSMLTSLNTGEKQMISLDQDKWCNNSQYLHFPLYSHKSKDNSTQYARTQNPWSGVPHCAIWQVSNVAISFPYDDIRINTCLLAPLNL